MVVEELIEKLRKYPPQMPVVILNNTCACDCGVEPKHLTVDALVVETWQKSKPPFTGWTTQICSSSHPMAQSVLHIRTDE